MKTLVTLAIGAIALVALGTANAATTKTYLQAGIGDAGYVTDCGPAHSDGTPDGFGGVCFDAGQLTIVNGKAQVSISDANSPVSGFVCQDNNNDDECGNPDLGEIGEPFCTATILGDGDTWNKTLFTIVTIDGPVFGGALSPCGTPSPGTVGSVSG